jgi:uroporphyrinogen III methyltransferase/synthase
LPDYRTGVPASLASGAAQVFALQPGWVTLTSSSTVKNLLAAVGPEALAGVRIASIGPVTSDVARRHGLQVGVEANPYTLDGLVSAILAG